MIVYLSSLLLWELGTNFPQSQPLVKDCQFGVSPVNYSDSDSDSEKFLFKMIFSFQFQKSSFYWAFAVEIQVIGKDYVSAFGLENLNFNSFS